MLAARGNHLAIMRALVQAGADAKLMAQDGSTLPMAAAGSGHIDLVKYAYELSPDVKALSATKSGVMHAAVTGPLQSSTQPEIAKVIQFLAEKGADLDPRKRRRTSRIEPAGVALLSRGKVLRNYSAHRRGI